LLKARVGSSLGKKRMTDELREWNLRLAERVDEKVREVERLNTLKRFVSPQLADVLAVGGDAILRSHRREITVLFNDLRGFTSFSEIAEPEEIMGVLREFHDAVGPRIFHHEGTIAQFTGDGMLVIFNDPVPLPDPAWNATQLAVEMRDLTAELSQRWRRRGHSLELGVGVAVGYATCGEIGFEGRTEYTAIGTVVNLAARICGIAPGGQILVSNRVQSAVEDRVESRHIGDIEFKGLSRPVPTYEIVGLRS
jgi:class 3 adenylate cyclase